MANRRANATTIPAILLLVAGFLLGHAVEAWAACDQGDNSHFVEILNDGALRSGTGVVLTSDGYILTARHVIKDFIEVGVRLPGEDEVVTASVIGTEELFDVALLKIPLPPGTLKPVTTTGAAQIALSTPATFCQWGYGIEEDFTNGTSHLLPLSGVISNFRQKSKGYVFTDAPLNNGFSGGGTMWNSRLFGLNLQRDITLSATRILPIHHIVSFLSRHGLEVDASGKIEGSPGFKGLLQFAKNNRARIDRMLRSVTWRARFPFMEGQDDALDLKIWFEKHFPVQGVRGFFIGKAIPHFDDANFRNWIDAGNEPLPFSINGSITADGTIVIRDFLNQLIALTFDYKDDHELQIDHRTVARIEITGRVREEAGTTLASVAVSVEKTRSDDGTEP